MIQYQVPILRAAVQTNSEFFRDECSFIVYFNSDAACEIILLNNFIYLGGLDIKRRCKEFKNISTQVDCATSWITS